MNKSDDNNPLSAEHWNLKPLTEEQIKDILAKSKEREKWMRETSGHAFNAPRKFLDLRINV